MRRWPKRKTYRIKFIFEILRSDFKGFVSRFIVKKDRTSYVSLKCLTSLTYSDDSHLVSREMLFFCSPIQLINLIVFNFIKRRLYKETFYEITNTWLEFTNNEDPTVQHEVINDFLNASFRFLLDTARIHKNQVSFDFFSQLWPDHWRAPLATYNVASKQGI